jgi:hypothetical protein
MGPRRTGGQGVRVCGGEQVVLELQVHEAALQRVAGVAHQVRVGVAAALQQRHMLQRADR